ncbi:hypothetical protein SCOCK_30334 [Actinacidiphila cocklensis]|uniref:Uncharacterized protein n=1 Tax=Actinacidiphila cocklensis TaxID=887465 RepID=A0A9W4DRU4_9ACTN|nr:hypothetical protein SCOCK_30334 [Actinacidiphila cocklensis]
MPFVIALRSSRAAGRGAGGAGARLFSHPKAQGEVFARPGRGRRSVTPAGGMAAEACHTGLRNGPR